VAEWTGVSRVVDPETGLDIDAGPHAELLDALLHIPEVQHAVCGFGRGTPAGFNAMARLLRHARKRPLGAFSTCNSAACPKGHDAEWWANFVHTVRTNLFMILAVRVYKTPGEKKGKPLPGGEVPLVNAAMQLAFSKGWPYIQTRAMLRQLGVELGEWLNRSTIRETQAGLLYVGES
jgi:hypothetical protein